MKGKRGRLSLFLAGAVVGIAAWVGFNRAVDYTNSLAFCISCHEMERTVYQEYRNSPHYRNASGVVAICSDCHVPRPFFEKLWKKTLATRDLYYKLTGSIATPEQFEQRRLLLAERVWEEMRARDSQACRECHDQTRMDPKKQSRRAQEKMHKGFEEGKSCIDCHKGIAHALPDDDD